MRRTSRWSWVMAGVVSLVGGCQLSGAPRASVSVHALRLGGHSLAHGVWET
jgi:uncharacterized membrane protein HdeD (DUF308 family)